MEEVVAVFFQLFFEMVIQFFGSSGLSWATGDDRFDRGCTTVVLHAIAGGSIGWISTLIAPHLVLPYAWMRLTNLIVSPALSGLISYGIAKYANSKGSKWDPTAHFLHGIMFALMFAGARLAFGAR